MGYLKLAKRIGGPKAWERGAVIGTENGGRVPVRLSMRETGSERIETDASGKRVVVDDRKRVGAVHAVSVVEGQVHLGEELWSGPVGLDATPLRATCVACGLVDEEGQVLPAPNWVPRA